jgi:membrane-associated phospholipid phosphatase
MTDPVLPDHEQAHPPGVHHRSPLIAAIAVAVGAIALLLLAGITITRHPFAIDRTIIVAVHGAGPVWLRQAMIDVTALGSSTVLTVVVAASAALLLVRGLWLTAVLTVAATATGALAVQVLKSLFARTRPDIVDHLVTVGGASFPSGHSANSAIVYLTLAGLLAQVARGSATRRFLLVAAVLLVTWIGASRVYLGVHWPSDVLAGWSFGTLWALGWWLAGARARATLLSGRDQTPNRSRAA